MNHLRQAEEAASNARAAAKEAAIAEERAQWWISAMGQAEKNIKVYEQRAKRCRTEKGINRNLQLAEDSRNEMRYCRERALYWVDDAKHERAEEARLVAVAEEYRQAPSNFTGVSYDFTDTLGWSSGVGWTFDTDDVERILKVWESNGDDYRTDRFEFDGQVLYVLMHRPYEEYPSLWRALDGLLIPADKDCWEWGLPTPEDFEPDYLEDAFFETE